MKARILVLDDDAVACEFLREALERDGYGVDVYTAATDALEQDLGQYDLLISDIRMPEMDGLQFLNEVRNRWPDLPVILMTAYGSLETTMDALRQGAWDYISKPFSLRELTARIKAVLRRSKNHSPAVATITVKNLRLEPSRFELYVDNTLLTLTPTEFKLINALLEYPGQVLSRLQLLERAYGDIYEGYERSIDTHISNLRRKLENAGSQISIKSVYGIGYKVEKEDNSNEDIP